MVQLKKKPEQVSDGHYLITMESDSIISHPGQFINIRLSKQNDPLLRRPFSIFDHNESSMYIIVKIIGRGTEMLAHLEPGEIDILGPLGTGFSIQQKKNVLVAGGGVGNSPLLYLAKCLAQSQCRITYIYGTTSGKKIFLPDLYRKYSHRFIITTDDGSEGKKAYVTDVASELLASEHFDMIYTCGPAPMMQKMTKLAKETPIEISVENYFGCGIGICSGCTIATSQGPKRACVDGPVFNGTIIDWNNIEE